LKKDEQQFNIKGENRIMFTWKLWCRSDINWTAVGQNQLEPVLSGQGYIPEPPPSPVNTLSSLYALKKKTTKHKNLLCLS
jgi:hypothetical protein